MLVFFSSRRRHTRCALGTGVQTCALPVYPTLGDVGPDTGVGAATSIADRSQLPPVANLSALDFPAIERTTLKNGIEVVFAHRDAVPTVQVAVSFDAGYAADPHGALGTQSLMLSLQIGRASWRERVGQYG